MDKMASNELGERLRILRKDRGMTQREVADRCGWHYQTLQRYENSSVLDPRLSSLLKLCEVYGVSLSGLVGR